MLRVKHSEDGDYGWPTSMTLGKEGTTILTESLEAYPEDYYRVEEFPISDPGDIDLDGFDDVQEFNNIPTQAPANAGDFLQIVDGAAAVESYPRFKELALKDTEIQWAPFLSDKEFVKFVIQDIHSEEPKIYFVNSQTHETHSRFMQELDISYADDVTTGEIIFHPSTVANNGVPGVFSFNFSLSFSFPFETTRLTHELLASHMPFLKNNLS